MCGSVRVVGGLVLSFIWYRLSSDCLDVMLVRCYLLINLFKFKFDCLN
jgi:hypothetical protein